jgi:hypothetical protein
MKTIKLKLSELVFDFDLYPRAEVDSHHVSVLRAADQAGATFPPYVIDAASKRVIDGFHRGRKDRMEHGPDCEVECLAKSYKSEGEMFLDAMRHNASHGRALTMYDRARCALRSKKFKLGIVAIAAALGMSVSSLKAVGEGRTAHVRSEKDADEGHEVALKKSVSHMSGRTLTADQQETNKKLSGMNQSFHANQLIMLIENDMLDKNDEYLMARLAKLAELLEQVIASDSVA